MEVAIFSNAETSTQNYKENETTGENAPIKEQNKSSNTEAKKKVYELPDGVYKVTVTEVLSDLRKMMHKQNKNFNEDGKHQKRIKQKFQS